MRKLVIAVDGPAGAGKSTVARAVADRLRYIYIDTGAMYRALTLAALRWGVPFDDARGLAVLLREAEIRLVPTDSGGNRIFLGEEDVTELIRIPAVNARVAKVAAHKAVREQMVEMQRQLAAGGGVVMDGRDIGTVVLPDADLKVFLTASAEARAHRRWEELKARGYEAELEDVQAAIVERDRNDTERSESPLRQAPDAVRIDSTGKSVEEVVEEILQLCESRVTNRSAGR